MTIPRNLSFLAEGASSTGVLGTANGGTGLNTLGTANQVLAVNSGGTALTYATVSSAGGGGTNVSGNVTLTSSSTGAQNITPTGYGNTVTLPNATTMTPAACVFNLYNNSGYPVSILDSSSNILGYIYPNTSVVVGLSSASTATGNWILDNAEPLAIVANTAFTLSGAYISYGVFSITLDSTRTLLYFVSNTSYLYGVIYNSSNQTFGTPTLISSNSSNGCIGLLSASNQVLMVYVGSTVTTLNAVVLTISGTSISVGTPVTKTGTSYSSNSFVNCLNLSSSYVFSYTTGATATQHVAITISGTTPTFGSVVTGTNSQYGGYTFAVSSTTFLAVNLYATNLLGFQAFSVSGTTITGGTNVTVSAINGQYFRAIPISGGTRVLVLYANSSNPTSASLASVSGTTVTLSTVTVSATYEFPGSFTDLQYSGSNALYADGINLFAWAFTDTSGTLTVGSAVSTAQLEGALILNYTGTSAVIASIGTNNVPAKQNISISGNTITASSTNIDIWQIQNATTSSGNPVVANFSNTSLWGGKNCYTLQGSINIALNTQTTLALPFCVAPNFSYLYNGKYKPNASLPISGTASLVYYNASSVVNNESWFFYSFSATGLIATKVQSIT